MKWTLDEDKFLKLNTGFTNNYLAEKLGKTYDAVKHRKSRLKIKSSFTKEDKMGKIDKIVNEFGITKNQIQRMLFEKKKPRPKVLKRYITDKMYKFGIVGDTHLCSTHEKLNELHTFYEICRKSGVKNIFHAGDIIAGWGMYFGQETEVHTFGASAQAQYVIDNYPNIKGIKTYFITGNHCLSWYKKSGIDVGNLIANDRDDMVYIGQFQGDMMLNKIRIKVLHPDGAGAYAISYRGQKISEQIPSGKKPDILILGHFHTSVYFFYRNMHIFHAGSFEGQSSFLLRKGINPAIGGWICEVHIGKKKDRVVALQACWIPFFENSK